ncbi:MAG: hypothetical protein M3131_01600 [Actinomycetota bacterium]|nr:hypothetical protein [Actinomycetota bacterium]
MTALRAVLLYTVADFLAKSVDHALAARLAPYGRWFESRRHKRSQRPAYLKALRKAAIAWATKLLLDATRAVARSLDPQH